MMPHPPSEALQDLIARACMIEVSTWTDSHSPAALQVLQTAATAERYLTDDDLGQLERLMPETAGVMAVMRMIRDRNTEIIADARGAVLRAFPGINQPGGALYPAKRSDACWRDFWQFLRSISYGIVSLRSHYTSTEGLHYLQLLYREVNVPLDAMLVGLEGLKDATLKRIAPEKHHWVAPYFDELITQLQRFY